MSDSTAQPTATITCAVCGLQEERPTLRAVLGDQCPFEGDDANVPYADRKNTGWVSALGVYLCPAHADRPETLDAETKRWRAGLACHLSQAEAEYKERLPPPKIGQPQAPSGVHTLTLSFPFDLYERIKALKLDPGKGFAPQLVERAERAADFEDDYRKVMSEKCAPDEVHCSCVPHLRRRIAELERDRIDLLGKGQVLIGDLADAEHELDDARSLRTVSPWADGVSLFINAEGPPVDIWHDGGPGGSLLSADTMQAARAIVSAIDELHAARKEITRLINERDAARIEIGHLQDELIKLCGAHDPTGPAEVAPERAPDPNALPGGGEGAVTALLMDYGIVDTPETRQQMRDTLMSALRAGAGPDGYYPARPTEDTGAPAWLRLEWSEAPMALVPYVVDPLPTHPATPTIPAARLRVLHDAHNERERQDVKFGRDRDHALTYGGFEGRPMDLCAAYGLPTADAAKARCDAAMKVGRVTYGHILVEEVCEFFEAAAGGDVAEVRKELVQVVAVGVAMVEALDRAVRRLAQADAREVER